EFLELTPANVRVILHRARKQLEQARGEPRTAVVDAQLEAALTEFLMAITERDTAKLERLLAEEVRATSDAGREVLAARKIVRGRAKVIALFMGIRGAEPRWSEFRSLNGEPAFIVELDDTGRRTAKRTAMRVELDDAGRICEIQIVLASRKLVAVDFSG